jgi:LacI family transcriptional regulator
MGRRATAQEVAKAAGVSKWTVIRAFKKGASISDENKRKVLKAARRLNYTPNLLARSLATNVTHQVAVFVDDFGNPEKMPFLEALTDRLQAEGLMAMLININNHFDHVHALLTANQRQVDAVILLGTGFRDETLRDGVGGRGTPPLFVLARDSAIKGVPAILCDAEVAMQEIGVHLHKRGYRRPIFMTGASAVSTALKREKHFMEFWARKGVRVKTPLKAAGYSASEGGEAIRSYLAETPVSRRADVLMCENDILALGALDVIRGEFGIRVPEEIAVVGFDNFNLGGTRAFGLTTYEQPIPEMIAATVAMIRGTRKRETVALRGQLIVRQST